MRAILSGTETTRRPAPPPQVTRQPEKPTIVQMDPRMITMLEKVARPPEPKPAAKPKPRIRVEAIRAPMSMGEMLRAYGHVKEGVPA